MLVSGDAGIGKSRLLTEFRDHVNPRATLVGVGACREFAQKPLGPIADVLDRLAAKVFGAPAQWHARSKAEQLDVIASTFAALAARRTTVVLLEDLQWADVELLQTLAVLAQRAASQRLLLVATYRGNEVDAAHPGFALFGRLLREPSASLVVLEPLGAAAMDELIRASLADRATLPSAVLHEVRRRADGNAFFAEELLRDAVDRYASGDAVQPNAVPLSLQAVVMTRLERCTVGERALLARASLFGVRFRARLLREIFGESAQEQSAALDALRELQLIDSTDATETEYRFRHALTRDIVYGDLEATQTRLLHAQIAEFLAAAAQAGNEPEELAHHFWHAGMFAQAAPYCEASGDAAAAVHAYEDAAAWYDRAVTGFGEEKPEIARVLLKAGFAVVLGDAVDRAAALYARAADLHLELGNVNDFVKARVLMAGPIADNGRPGEAVAILESTLRTAADRADPPFHHRLLVRLANLYALTARDDDAWRCVEAVDAASVEPGSTLEAEYAFLRSKLHARRGDSKAWRELTERGIVAFDLSGALPDNRRVAFSNAGLQALHLGETWLARSYLTRALQLARTTGVGVAFEAAALGEVELYAGNYSAARELLRHAQPARRFQARAQVAMVDAALTLLAADKALHDCLDPALLEEAEAAGDEAVRVRLACAFAPVLVALDRSGEANAMLARARDGIHTPFGMAQPIVTIALNAPELVEPLRPAIAEAAARGGDRIGMALLNVVDAALAGIRGDGAAAQASGLAGARAFEAIGWPWHEARCREFAGDASGALGIYRRIGAVRDVRRLERHAAAGSVPGGVLTRRERELAAQVAAGKPNRAAAAALSISEKAVEKYLTSIYAKLGLRSRTELAAYIASRRDG